MLARYMTVGFCVLTAWGSTAQAQGDANCDGSTNGLDVYAFVLAVTDPVAYQATFQCDLSSADLNCDGTADASDINAFVACLLFGTCPTCGPDDMALVAGGTYEMGCHVATCTSDELPIHSVDIASFYMDVFEATNQQYADFLNAGYSQGSVEVIGAVVYQSGGGQPYCDTHTADLDSHILWDSSTFTVTAGWEDRPMVEVSWYGAAAYGNARSAADGLQPCYDLSTWVCDFNADGYRLPTEAEWEYAARGGEHSPYYKYPWGDAIDGSNANYASSGDPFEGGTNPWTTPVGYYDGAQTPAGSDMANGYGLYDMVGNVWEWCNDWYDPAYYSTSPSDNPTGPATGVYRLLRGEAWDGADVDLRTANRGGATPGQRYGMRGFRLVTGL